MATKNTVTAPLVLVTNEAGAVEYFYRGSVLPAYVKGDTLKGLVDEGMVGSQEDLTAQPAEGVQVPAEKPAAKGK